MLFSQQEHPVFIFPVCGCLIEKDKDNVQAYPHVPSLTRVQWFPGLRDLEPDKYPSSFTVFPILALDTATFGQILYTLRAVLSFHLEDSWFLFVLVGPSETQ
jgi:hypothetical protein